jgi:hydroxypyruvate reductase
MTADSFASGRALLRFAEAHDEITFLTSGGGSACVESPLAPFTERDLIDTNSMLVRSGAPIGEINCVRKHLSAIKGGRLGAGVKKRSVTLVYSDVPAGAPGDVASGPTVPDTTTKSEAIAILERLGGCDRIVTKLRDERCPETVHRIANGETILVADNDTLTSVAASIAQSMGFRVALWEGQIESDVAEAARALVERARMLRSNEVLIAGGEPTVVARGDGKGGRCSELAVRMALLAGDDRLRALFGSSDGVDGSSGVAGILVTCPSSVERQTAERELARSNSFAVAERIGEPIRLPATGNNLRDLYLLACS